VIKNLKGVGPQKLKSFSGLGIKTVEDLLFHLPLRYEDRTRLSSISTIQEKQLIVVLGVIQ
jgi:ATP-dependent DNA helicase RecG